MTTVIGVPCFRTLSLSANTFNNYTSVIALAQINKAILFTHLSQEFPCDVNGSFAKQFTDGRRTDASREFVAWQYMYTGYTYMTD